MSPQLVTCMQSLAPTFTPTQCIHCIRPQSRLLKVDGLKTAGKYSSTRGSFLPLLLPECLCLWACVCVWVCMDMYDGMMVYGGQSSLSSIFLRVTHFFFSRQGLSDFWNLPSSSSQGPVCCCLSRSRITCTCHHVWPRAWVPGNRTQVLRGCPEHTFLPYLSVL